MLCWQRDASNQHDRLAASGMYAQAQTARLSGSDEPYKFVITKEYVAQRLGELVKRQDLSKYVL